MTERLKPLRGDGAKLLKLVAEAQDLQTLERQLWSSMPPAVKAMLDFSANSGARGS